MLFAFLRSALQLSSRLWRNGKPLPPPSRTRLKVKPRLGSEGGGEREEGGGCAGRRGSGDKDEDEGWGSLLRGGRIKGMALRCVTERGYPRWRKTKEAREATNTSGQGRFRGSTPAFRNNNRRDGDVQTSWILPNCLLRRPVSVGNGLFNL